MQTAPLFEKLVSTNTNIANILGIEGAKDYKHVICQGGGDSAKTVSIIQMLCTCANLEPGTKTLIAADSMPNLKDGAIYTFERFVEPDFSPFIKSYHKTDKLITWTNKSMTKFKSFENEHEARGSLWDYAYFNESTLFSWDLYWQIQRKTRRQVFQDFNPTAAFWAHKNLVEGGEAQFRGKWKRFIVDHRHNPFLTKEQHDEYESITDPELFKVYSRGQTGKVTGLIFGHFKRLEKMPEDCDRYIWGIDYGYTNDPTAIVKVGIKGRNRYIQEVCYIRGTDKKEARYEQFELGSAAHIKQVLIDNGWKEGQVIYSEIDEQMILQLRKLRLPVYQARKGPGSKVAGISKLREFNCFYIGDNFHLEIMNYKYVTAIDALSGKIVLTNEPMDGYDHLCDASRYCIYTDALVNRL